MDTLEYSGSGVESEPQVDSELVSTTKHPPIIQLPELVVSQTTEETTQNKDNEKEKDEKCEPKEEEEEEEEENKENKSGLLLPNAIIQQQQKLIDFEPFEFKDGNEATFDTAEDSQADQDDEKDVSSSVQAALRRQSLFKLREKINGKVSRHVNEIEKRKLSPYRFSHSPLKQPRKMFKVSVDTAISPKTPLIVQDAKNMVRACVGQICRTTSGTAGRLSRQQQRASQSAKQQRMMMSLSSASSGNQFTSNLSSIAENVSAMADMSSLASIDEPPVKQVGKISNAGSKHVLSTQLKCTNEAIDL